MTIGSSSARPRAGSADIPRILLNLLLACMLACSFVPSAAWADDAPLLPDEDTPTVEQAAEPDQAPQPPEPSDEETPAPEVAPVDTPEATIPEADVESDADASTPPPASDASAPAVEEEVATPAETVSVRLVVSRSFKVEGEQRERVWVDAKVDVPVESTVEQALDLAVEAGLIEAYTHGEPYPGYAGYYVNSMTIAGAEYRSASDFSSFWSFTVNGDYDDSGINITVVKDGMRVGLQFVDGSSSSVEGDVEVDPDASHPSLPNDAPVAPSNSGAVESVKLPSVDAAEAKTSWKQSVKQLGSDFTNVSDVLLAGGNVYVAACSGSYSSGSSAAVLYVYSQKTGKLVGTAPLAGGIDFSCHPVYADGIVVVPLAQGRVQGVSAATLKTVWLTEPVSASSQALSSLTVSDGSVFMNTVDRYGEGYVASAGTMLAFDLLTGALKWKKTNESAGYYWSGVTARGSVLVYGDDAGVLSAVDAATGDVLSQLELGASIRSSATLDAGGGTAFVGTTAGRVCKVAIGADGDLHLKGTASFAAYSTSTPTLFDGKLFVGGQNADYTGVLAVVDARTMKVLRRVTTTVDGAALPAHVQSRPTVARTKDGGVVALFTCNAQPGGMYAYELGDEAARMVYTPQGDDANWGMKSVVVGPDGTLYYSNDSGTLFAVMLQGKDSSGGGSGSHDGNQGTENPGKGYGESNDGESNDDTVDAGPAPSSRKPLGSVVPAHRPVTKMAGTSKGKTEAEGKDEGDSSKAAAEPRAIATSDDAARAVGGESGFASGASEGAPKLVVNPWAACGIALGVVGLVCAGAYAMRARRKEGGAA